MSIIFIPLVLFIICFVRERRSFLNVILLGATLLSILIKTIFNDQLLLDKDYFVTDYFILLIFLFIPTIFLILSIGMFFSSKILLEKEGRKLRNLLLPCIALLFLIFIAVYIWMISSKSVISNSNEILVLYCMFIFFYFVFLYTSSACYSVVYYFAPICYTPDFIIVLGSGLIGDRVPPLLASRLNKAADLYEKYDKKPRIITSGGQGSDELVSESFAMRKYLIEQHGINPELILMEDQSVNTLQNMQFSKNIMDHLHPNAKAIFVTNEFHLFRASLYARKVNITGNGVGSRTAFYYVPNAFSREFVALLEMYKWYHLVFIAIITTITFFLWRAYL